MFAAGGTLSAVVRHAVAIVIAVSLGAPASARPRRPAATLEIDPGQATRVQVFLGKKELRAIDVLPDGHLQVALPGSGFQRLRIRYVRPDGASTHEVLVPLGAGVKLLANETWGTEIVAPHGARCGAVSGHPGPWFLCDGPTPLPAGGVTFALDCAAPVASADEGYYRIERADHDAVESATFVPALPGLYRAKYANGRITLRHEAHDCGDALPTPWL
jgi:hypothetical protein